MNKPPLPHLTGGKRKQVRKTIPLWDKNTTQFMIGLTGFLFLLSLFLWKTTFDLYRINPGWTWETIVVAVVNFGLDIMVVGMFRLTWQQRFQSVARNEIASTNYTALGNSSASASPNTHKPKPLAMAIVFFIGFLIVAGFDVWATLSTSQYHRPSMQNIVLSAFCSLALLAGSIWAFRWWHQERKVKLT